MKKKYFIWPLLVIAVILGSWAWLSSAPLTRAKIAIHNTLPLPMFSVNGSHMTVRQYLERLDTAQNISASLSQTANPNLSQNLYARLVEEKKLEAVASRNQISVPKKQLEREYASRSESFSLSEQGSLEEKLGQAGISKTQYEEAILRPELLRVNLIVWYNSQKDLNKNDYGLAEDILNRLNKTAEFGELAKAYSQDPGSKAVLGDMGFARLSSILPEMQEAVDSLKPGDYKLIPSRYGLHIVQMLGREKAGAEGGESVHIKQIFLKTSGFETWYNNQTKSLKIKTWVKI